MTINCHKFSIPSSVINDCNSPPFLSDLGIWKMLYPSGVNSDITLLSIAVPSQVSIRTRMSMLLERRKSLIEVDLFLTDRRFNETSDTLFP